MDGYIYMLTDKRNGKKYIGKHNGSNKNYFTGGKIPRLIIKKHGRDVFVRIILENNIRNLEELNEKEMFYIEHNNTFNNGYNCTKGGDGGGEWIYQKTEQEKERIRKIKREKNLGRVFSKETRKKMSISKKGIPLTEEHKRNISINNAKPFLGKKHSLATKRKISKKKIGIKNPSHSKFMSNNNPRSKPISINGVIYKDISEAHVVLGASRTTVRRRLNSKDKQFKKWFFVKK